MPTTTEPFGKILGDTNVLLRFANGKDARHEFVSNVILSLEGAGWRICYTPQSIRELWSVMTRPESVNGLGYDIATADATAQIIETHFTLLHDTPAMHDAWRRLVVEHAVRGVQVHDARLAASGIVAGCRAILTLNDPDFKRFGIPALHPRDAPAFLAA